jgi:uncharacterized damage-inducible protein DinB
MESTSETLTGNALFVKTSLKAWILQVNRLSQLIETLTDEDLKREIAPGRNTGVYVLGHLTAVNDGIIPLLGFGKKLYPELEQPFITSPDNTGLPDLSLADLRQYWKKVNEVLIERFQQLEPDQWLTRHEAVSPEDFAKEPHRNKLNVLISRANHMSYHWGQLILLKGKGD